MRSKEDGRRRDLAAIHTGKRALSLDDGAYRALLEELTGKRSAADLSATERARVLDRMRSLGFRRRPGGRKPRRQPATQIDKARALWRALAAAGALRDSSNRALQAFGERMTGKSRLDWCTPRELVVVIEALKSWLARAESAQTASGK